MTGSSSQREGEIRSFRDLIVWRKSMELVTKIHELVGRFPKTEEYRLTSQLMRAVVSIPANIAEGQRRGSRKDYANFVTIARGSTAEVETLLLVANRVQIATEAETAPLVESADEISRMLFSLRAQLLAAR